MADILIRGMEMPKDNNAISIIIFSNGKVSQAHDKKYAEYAEAVPLPEGHGDLVDVKELLNDKEGLQLFKGDFRLAFDRIIERANTVVPAEGGSDNA